MPRRLSKEKRRNEEESERKRESFVSWRTDADDEERHHSSSRKKKKRWRGEGVYSLLVSRLLSCAQFRKRERYAIEVNSRATRRARRSARAAQTASNVPLFGMADRAKARRMEKKRGPASSAAMMMDEERGEKKSFASPLSAFHCLALSAAAQG